MTGAGGIRATDYLANVAPKDGTSLGMLLDLAAATQVLQPKVVHYDLSKFSVIGTFVTDNPATPAIEVQNWGRATELISPRFARFQVQFDF